jgi:hypothetical protein
MFLKCVSVPGGRQAFPWACIQWWRWEPCARYQLS